MKSFFKFTFACILGVMISGFIGIILLIIGVVNIASFQAPAYSPSSNTIFSLKLNSSVVERFNNSPMDEVYRLINDQPTPIGLNEILESIDKAKENSNIIGISLNSDGYSASYATSEAIRRKLIEFQKSGKFIVAYNDSYTQNQYYLSSVADSIFLNPVGSLIFSGLSSQTLFLKDALDKLGVEMQVFRVGTFKSAVEPYMSNKMSAANREQTETYMNSIWDTVLTGISDSRSISKDSLDAFANLGLGYYKSSLIYDKGLVSALKYKSEMKEVLEGLAGTKKFSTAKLKEISSMGTSNEKTKNRIAILYADGEIASGPTKDGIYWESVIKDIDKIEADDQIKALVFRINSPGGSAFASEQIWEAIERLKKKIPVVVSMGSYAASGGYYIACGANYIFAESATLTGSIGVFGVIPNAKGLLTDKLGLNVEEVKTNQFGSLSLLTPISEVEKALIQASVEDVYELFLKRCADGRNMSMESIEKVAEGRVWSGSNALEIGLVDELGGIDRAILKAAALASIEKYDTKDFPASDLFIEDLLKELTDDASLRVQKAILGHDYYNLQFIKYIQTMDHMQARMDFVVVK